MYMYIEHAVKLAAGQADRTRDRVRKRTATQSVLALRRKDLSPLFSAASVAIKAKTSSSEFASFPEYDDGTRNVGRIFLT